MTSEQEKGSDIWSKFDRLLKFLVKEAKPEEPGLKFAHVINFFKFGMPFMCFGLMFYFNNFSLPALLITLFHGSYGLLWLFKDVVFPDKTYEMKLDILAIIMTSLTLAHYALMALMITSNSSYTHISIERMLVAGYMYIFGVVLMMISDAQKTFTLKIKKGLICTGLSGITRNPNYLGEIFLYLSFGVLAQSVYCYGFLIFVWVVLFGTNMKRKDKSLMKKEGWKKYSQKSYLLLPKIFSQGNHRK